ncbi:MAG: ribbon-helix-helix protein, CopG family [Verrucomicrobiae bacterium]|nr:ribbon-helix-helix protein, CopG family [Verrucomicrobiae bacterium]
MKTSSPSKDAILSVRISAEMDERLKKAAKALDLSKNDVARGALRATLEAMEMRRYRIEWPLRMDATPRPTRAEREDTRAILEDVRQQVNELLERQAKRSARAAGR